MNGDRLRAMLLLMRMYLIGLKLSWAPPSSRLGVRSLGSSVRLLFLLLLLLLHLRTDLHLRRDLLLAVDLLLLRSVVLLVLLLLSLPSECNIVRLTVRRRQILERSGSAIRRGVSDDGLPIRGGGHSRHGASTTERRLLTRGGVGGC